MLYLATKMILNIIMNIRMNYTCYINGLIRSICHSVFAAPTLPFKFSCWIYYRLNFTISLKPDWDQGSISKNCFIPYADLSCPMPNFTATKSFSKLGEECYQFSIGCKPVYKINPRCCVFWPAFGCYVHPKAGQNGLKWTKNVENGWKKVFRPAFECA